jgi:hypothetical protein
LGDNGPAAQTLLGVSIPPGYINRVVGTGTNSYGGDGGSATSAMIRFILITSFDPSGNFYLFDYQSARFAKPRLQEQSAPSREPAQ